MRLVKKILCLSFLVGVLIFNGCSSPLSKHERIIPSPSKIIAYNNGKTKELISVDKEYEKIVKLTNERVEKEELSVAKDGVDIDKAVDKKKQKDIAVEFIYDEEQKIDIKNSNGFTPIKFNKLFFKLSEENENDTDNTCFQYGNKDKYVDSSRGPIKKSAELLKVVKDIFK